jgi:hypothetical protein
MVVLSAGIEWDRDTATLGQALPKMRGRQAFISPMISPKGNEYSQIPADHLDSWNATSSIAMLSRVVRPVNFGASSCRYNLLL